MPEIVRTFEALAAIDANIAWCVNLGAGANMFAGYFAPEVAQTIFSNPKTALAGSGSIGGAAQPCEGGWRVSGQWKYASGSQHATHFTANAQLTDAAGTALHHPDGSPVFLSFLFPASEVTTLPRGMPPPQRHEQPRLYGAERLRAPCPHLQPEPAFSLCARAPVPLSF